MSKVVIPEHIWDAILVLTTHCRTSDKPRVAEAAATVDPWLDHGADWPGIDDVED